MRGNPLIQKIAENWKSLCKMLLGTWKRPSHQPLRNVDPKEEISSFVFREDQFYKSTKKLRYTRLMPRRNKSNNRLEVSICRSSNLSEGQIWDICSEHFDPSAPAAAIGRGVGNAVTVYAQQLEFDPDGNPYAEHANIIGWHDDPSKPINELKHFWMAKAQKMAPNFLFKPRLV